MTVQVGFRMTERALAALEVLAYRQGLSPGEMARAIVADRLGMTVDDVKSDRSEPRKKWRRVKTGDVRDARKMRASGVAVSRIARHLNVPRSTLVAAVASLGGWNATA